MSWNDFYERLMKHYPSLCEELIKWCSVFYAQAEQAKVFPELKTVLRSCPYLGCSRSSYLGRPRACCGSKRLQSDLVKRCQRDDLQ